MSSRLQYSGHAVLLRSFEAHAQIAAFQDGYALPIAVFVLAIPATWWIVRRIPGMPGTPAAAPADQ